MSEDNAETLVNTLGPISRADSRRILSALTLLADTDGQCGFAAEAQRTYALIRRLKQKWEFTP